MFFPSPPFSSSSSATFPFPFCSDLDGVSFQDPTSSAPLFFLTLTVHSPLPLTVPLGRFFLFPFGSFSLSSNPHSPSLVYGFPGFLSFFGPLSSLRFVPFSLFPFFYFFTSSPLFFSPSRVLALGGYL